MKFGIILATILFAFVILHAEEPTLKETQDYLTGRINSGGWCPRFPGGVENTEKSVKTQISFPKAGVMRKVDSFEQFGTISGNHLQTWQMTWEVALNDLDPSLIKLTEKDFGWCYIELRTRGGKEAIREVRKGSKWGDTSTGLWVKDREIAERVVRAFQTAIRRSGGTADPFASGK